MAMKRTIILILCLMLGGCADKVKDGWVADGHPYVPSVYDEYTFPEPVTEDMLKEEKPIVRIISGSEVSGVEEARARLAAQGVAVDLGLRTHVDQLALKGVPLIQMAAMLSEMSGFNIAVTRDAAEIPISVFLQDISLRLVIETVCRLNDLWYREDERIITLMTTDEYAKEMVIRRNEKSRAYWLRYSNANDMARILQAIMGSQVLFNDIGKEEVYGHVDEEKAGGTSVSLEDEYGGSGAGAASTIGTDLKGFDKDEIRKLLALGNLRKGKGDALDLHEQIEKKVPAVITVFKRNNAILARSLDETILQDISKIIELMDTPTSQVLLEITILQLTLGDGFESFFQVDFPGSYKPTFPDQMYSNEPSNDYPAVSPDIGYWGVDAEGEKKYYNFDYAGRQINYAVESVGKTLGSSLGLASTTFNVLFGNKNIQARLELFAKEDRVEVLATPYLMSANNSKVEFFVGEEVPLRDDVETNTLFNKDGFITTTTFEVKIKREKLGTELEISSFINEDGTITMDLDAEISSPNYNVTTIGVVNDVTGEVIPFPLDGVNTNELTSIITSASGQPIAIGGIIRERLEEAEKKVPLLGDIPLLGFFFKEVSDKKIKTETIFLLTPHIIMHPALAWQESRKFLDRRSSHPRFIQGQENILDYPTVQSNALKKETTIAEPVEPDPFDEE